MPPPTPTSFFCHSDTSDGRAIGDILASLFPWPGPPSERGPADRRPSGHRPEAISDQGPAQPGQGGLPVIRDYGAPSCAINATGGYKAQIAVAVLMGQALGVPVYYKHELFDEIIAFPPMPVALDFEAWMRISGLLWRLEQEPQPADELDDYPGDDETIESLVNREAIDGRDYLELSATGQIFHETFRERFRTHRDHVLAAGRPARPEEAATLRGLGSYARGTGAQGVPRAAHRRCPPCRAVRDLLQPSCAPPAREVLGRSPRGRRTVQRRQGPGQVPGRDPGHHRRVRWRPSRRRSTSGWHSGIDPRHDL